jgi:hypothetical protein
VPIADSGAMVDRQPPLGEGGVDHTDRSSVHRNGTFRLCRNVTAWAPRRLNLMADRAAFLV